MYLEQLLLVLGALYLAECCIWIRRDAVLLRARSWGRHRIVHPSQALGNERGGPVVLWPLPPLRPAFVVHQWPVSLTAEAACSRVSQTLDPSGQLVQENRLVRFEAIGCVCAAGHAVEIDGQQFLALDSDQAARHIAGVLEELRRTKPARRDAAIARILHASLDTHSVADRLDDLHRRIAPVRDWCACIMMLVFIAMPVVIGMPRARPMWPGLLALFIVCLLGLVRAFGKAHRRLMPEAIRHRRLSLLTIVLSPISAMRACDRLTRHVLADVHPLAAAAVLCGEDDFRMLARRVLQDLRHPLQPNDVQTIDETTQRVTEAFGRTLAEAVNDLIVDAGFDPAQLTAPPAAEYPSCRSYCPRCDQQYDCEGGSCSQCPGVALQRLPESAPGAAMAAERQ